MQAAYAYSSGFVAWLEGNGGDLRPDDPDFAAKLLEAFASYNNAEEAQAQLAIIAKNAGEPVAERLQEAMRPYIENQLAPYMTEAFSQMLDQAGGEDRRRDRLPAPDGAWPGDGSGCPAARAAPCGEYATGVLG